MKIKVERVARAQQLMAREGMIGIMIMTRDDYRYFFAELRVQPRAIIPLTGKPTVIAFAGEGPELRAAVRDQAHVRTFRDVGEQMTAVREIFGELIAAERPPDFLPAPDDTPRVGMQLWFETPAFLTDLFRKLNRQVELVSSDPVMDELRMVKEPAEVAALAEAQSLAALGMERARALIEPGATGHEIATEVLYSMMQAGAEGTSTPIYINTGIRTCWNHGKADHRPIRSGDLVVVNLTPQVQGYGANLARTFVVGTPAEWQRHLYDTYLEMRAATVAMLKPGVRVMDLDVRGAEICAAAGLGDSHIDGVAHGIGLRFEETPASTIIKGHRRVALRDGMTMAVGHTILAIPGRGGVRVEDVFLVTEQGGRILEPYPLDRWIVGA
jgi:Xaa-Pro aminopeptidase/Xaa-Pro dipeptidase